MHHFGPNIAAQKLENVVSPNVKAEPPSFDCEGVVEFGRRDLTAFESSPGIGVGVAGIDRADGVEGQATFGLVALKSLEGTAENHASEIPEHSGVGS